MSDEALLALMESQRRKLENYRVQTIELRQQVAVLTRLLEGVSRQLSCACLLGQVPRCTSCQLKREIEDNLTTIVGGAQ